MSQDDNVSRVCAMLQSRSKKGVERYGVTTERKDYSDEQWLRNLQEELMDATVYIEALLSQKSDAFRSGWTKGAEKMREQIADSVGTVATTSRTEIMWEVVPPPPKEMNT